MLHFVWGHPSRKQTVLSSSERGLQLLRRLFHGFFLPFSNWRQWQRTAWMGAEHIKTYDDCSITCWQIVFILPLFHVEKLKLAKQYQSIPLVGKAMSKRNISFTEMFCLYRCSSISEYAEFPLWRLGNFTVGALSLRVAERKVATKAWNYKGRTGAD